MERKGYSDGPFGQVHWRSWGSETAAGQRDLYCLHPAPFSGLAYQNLAPLLATGRRVIAPDYPGYGGSDAHTLEPSIDDYALAIQATIADLSGQKPIDVLGFHTGCLVAADLGRQLQHQVKGVCLIDIPAFPAEQSKALAASNGEPPEITDTVECLAKPWKSGFSSRLEVQGEAQAFAMFVEHIRAGKAMNAAFHAAFSYPWEQRFKEVTQDVLVIASQSGLLQGSRVSAGLMPHATCLEKLDITRSVLDGNAAQITPDIIRYLEGL